MTLEQMKYKVLRLIEETNEGSTYTDDPDIQLKLNDVINQIMFELARMKKIPEKLEQDFDSEYIAEHGLEYNLKDIENFYQLDNIRFTDLSGAEREIDVNMNYYKIPEEGHITIYYYKYPHNVGLYYY